MRIEIDRPEKKNALTLAMYSALTAAFDSAEQKSDVRVIFVHGAQGCFTSGNDLKDFLDSPPVGESSPVFRFLGAISQATKPIIAAVQGPAVGVGTTMLLHCDLVLAGQSARFQLPFVNLGLCPEAASSFLLPLLAGYQRAAELLLWGETFGSDKACEIGLVNEVLPDGELMERAWARARSLAARPPASVRCTKALLKKGWEKVVRETMSEEGKLFAQRLASPEAGEAIGAFFERRKPDFSKFK
jgi:enoyl-CoA hydratase/carnithine racemase